MHRWATDSGRNVPRACGAAPLGYGNGAEMSPERVVMHCWATETGVGVARACGVAPLGYGNGRKCRSGVRRGAVRRRNGAEMFPGRATRHRWATETDRSVPRACGAATLGDGNGRKCRPSVRCGTLGRRKCGKVREVVCEVLPGLFHQDFPGIDGAGPGGEVHADLHSFHAKLGLIRDEVAFIIDLP